MFSEPLKPILF